MNRPKYKKALAYARRMISSRVWKSNEKIPTLSAISKTISVSIPVIRMAIRQLEQEKVIENYGSLGFFVMSDALAQRHKLNRTSFLLHMAANNINVARLIHYKHKIFGQYGIGYDTNTGIINAHNLITHAEISLHVNEISDIINNPVTARQMVDAPDCELQRLKSKYKRQTKLSTLAKVVHLNRKELGICNG